MPSVMFNGLLYELVVMIPLNLNQRVNCGRDAIIHNRHYAVECMVPMAGCIVIASCVEHDIASSSYGDDQYARWVGYAVFKSRAPG